ncbi:MAG: DUF4136 domain-containing protein [Bacteroidales bacterium]|nr:DUF4136 domain-containing protein [Bacteroidales bacterium]
MKRQISYCFLVLILITSCSKYPPASERLTEELAIYTQFDVSIAFNDYQTFAIVPAVAFIGGNDSATITSPDALALLNRIAQNMVSRGFKQVAATANPDLGINVTAIRSTITTVYSPGWHWSYPGYYPAGWWGYPGYKYGYPYYPAYMTTYATGSVIIELIDLQMATDNMVMVRWNAFIRGVLNNRYPQTDVLNTVDQAFKQTPAIKTF